MVLCVLPGSRKISSPIEIHGSQKSTAMCPQQLMDIRWNRPCAVHQLLYLEKSSCTSSVPLGSSSVIGPFWAPQLLLLWNQAPPQGSSFLLYRETIDQLALLSCRPIKVRAVYFSPNLVYSSRKDLMSLRFIWSYYVHSNNFHRDYEKHCLENGVTVVCDLWYICMIRYNIEFASNEYVATWKHAQYILLNGKIRMWNYMFIMITTIISYDYDHYYLWFFLCRNRDYNSSVRMKAMSYIIIKRYFLPCWLCKVIKVLNTYFTKLLASIKHTCVCLIAQDIWVIVFLWVLLCSLNCMVSSGFHSSTFWGFSLLSYVWWLPVDIS